MAEDAQSRRQPFASEDGEPVETVPRSRLGVIVAALLALCASAGLAWWFAAPNPAASLHDPTPPAAVIPKTAPAAPLSFAGDEPDPNQVRRAWRDVQAAYVDGGPDALVRASETCARSLPAEPQTLDYCVALDTYAGEIVPAGTGSQADWFHDSGQRDLALARTALPGGADPQNRIAQVAALTRAVLPKAEPPKPAVVRAVRHAPTKAKASKVRLLKAHHVSRRHGVHANSPKTARHRPHARVGHRLVAKPIPLRPLREPDAVNPPDEGLDPPH